MSSGGGGGGRVEAGAKAVWLVVGVVRDEEMMDCQEGDDHSLGLVLGLERVWRGGVMSDDYVSWTLD